MSLAVDTLGSGAPCNICEVRWPFHDDHCIYLKTAEDLKAAKARVAELDAMLVASEEHTQHHEARAERLQNEVEWLCDRKDRLQSDLEVAERNHRRAEAEVKRLRQGLWDCATAAGVDTDGDKTPDHLAFPDIVDYALEAVRELREVYEEDDA